MSQPIPIKGQGGYARKVQDTAAERDRLLTALKSIANWTWTEGESDAERVEDLQGLARFVVAEESMS